MLEPFVRSLIRSALPHVAPSGLTDHQVLLSRSKFGLILLFLLQQVGITLLRLPPRQLLVCLNQLDTPQQLGLSTLLGHLLQLIQWRIHMLTSTVLHRPELSYAQLLQQHPVPDSLPSEHS